MMTRSARTAAQRSSQRAEPSQRDARSVTSRKTTLRSTDALTAHLSGRKHPAASSSISNASHTASSSSSPRESTPSARERTLLSTSAPTQFSRRNASL